MAARLKWRCPVDSRTRQYERWLVELRGKGLSGVYLIRDSSEKRVLYVGESHNGRLYGALTRHLYDWCGPESGRRYEAAHVEIAIVVADNPLTDPVADQFAYIQKFRPRDNTHEGHLVWCRMMRRQKAIAA